MVGMFGGTSAAATKSRFQFAPAASTDHPFAALLPRESPYGVTASDIAESDGGCTNPQHHGDDARERNRSDDVVEQAPQHSGGGFSRSSTGRCVARER
ncbi:hypothetical protein ASF72_18550 [Arthrobacter sp. Leaf141]|uniref:hypothetical protein n=1 Tax=Arthrobacter sp. Leaf141 TaxID=1736273 RepID=UPI000701DA2B|nr:hypothetical protein [Arthrobacter sp. Leaf141]KQQ98442.1 hypothetical protein ASF72_18550 [Arthrobacter sp. Leaf141]